MTNIPFHNQKIPIPILLPILTKTKEAYRLWAQFLKTIPKDHRYTLGQRIDTLFIELIEFTYQASQTETKDRLPYLNIAVRKINTLNLLILTAWEINCLCDNKYLALSSPLNESAKMLGGWLGKTKREQSGQTKLPDQKVREK